MNNKNILKLYMTFCPLKKFKNILGIPKKGVHQYRIFNTASVDYFLTLLLSFITTWITKIPLVLTTIGWFIISMILHMLFGIDTNTLKYLGIQCV